MRLVEEEAHLRLLDVSDLRQLLEELREEPHQRGREELRLVLDGGQLEARDDPAPVRRRPKEILHVELRLAEELCPPAVLEPHERTQQHADGLRREAADAREL